MSADHSASGIQSRRLRNGAQILIPILLTLCLLMLIMAPIHAAETFGPQASATADSRPQPAEEDVPDVGRRVMPASEHRIADPEREFAMRMLESVERELRLAEAHARISTDTQLKQIANDAAATRRNEIEKLRAWLSQRKVLNTPRMLNR